MLKKLSPQEMKGFKSYLNGFYPRQKVLLTTFDYLHKYHPGFRLIKKLEADYAYQKIFGQPLVNKTQRSNLFNTLGEIKKYLEDYLLWLETQKAGYKREKMLMDIYRERNIQPFYQKYFEQVRNRLEEDDNQDMWNEFRKLELAHQKYFYKNTSSYKDRVEQILELEEFLNAFWINSMLKFGCEMAFLKGLVRSEKSLSMLSEASRLQQNAPFRNKVFNHIYGLMLELFAKSDLQKYKTAKKLIFENFQHAEPSDQSIFYGFLINYVAKQLKQPNSDLYHKEALDIYKLGLEAEVLLDEGKISSIAFNNIIKTACDADDISFANFVVGNYQKNLPEDVRGDAVAVGKAIILTHQKDYDGTLKILSTGDYNAVDLGLRYRGLKLICLFEEKKLDLLDFHCNAFESWTRRQSKKLGEANSKACLNLVRYTRRLIRLNENKSALEHEIRSSKSVFLKSWLLDKVKEY